VTACIETSPPGSTAREAFSGVEGTASSSTSAAAVSSTAPRSRVRYDSLYRILYYKVGDCHSRDGGGRIPGSFYRAAGGPPPRRIEFGHGPACAAKGRVDLYVASTGGWNLLADDDRLWAPPLALAGELAKRSGFRRWPAEHTRTQFRSLADFRRKVRPVFSRTDRQYPSDGSAPGTPGVLRAGGIMAPGVSWAGGVANNIIVSRGPLKTGRGLVDSIVLINGNIDTGTRLARSGSAPTRRLTSSGVGGPAG
jgi:hypothetical protein